MSEKILKALMQLFAIIAKVENPNGPRNIIELLSNDIPNRKLDIEIVENFLKSELNSLNVKKYLDLFREYVIKQNKIQLKKYGNVKRASLNSVKVLRICSEINKELTQRQKFIVLIRLIEFIESAGRKEHREIEFISIVSEMFNISLEENNVLLAYLERNTKKDVDNSNVLFLDNKIENLKSSPELFVDGIEGHIRVLRIKSINTLFFRYLGSDELYMNGQLVSSRTHVLNQGSRIKTSKSNPIYYSDVITKFINDNFFEKFTLSAKNVSYNFRNSESGIKPLSFEHKSGDLVGLMGSSGSGKTTLLNILNGNIYPDDGSIEINEVNIHKERKNLEGFIGYISQDDLLIEELTVYQNLFYNARLCFNDLGHEFVHKRVLETLLNIGLLDIKDQLVGGVFNQGISGGQRKRLNIALELIREPAILFIDEPTSGLSSSDSENIIDLLKELSLKGKLIYVVIHQPSSDIYKKIDKLLLLDMGGYLIYNGNPVDALVYFKSQIDHVNADERECSLCGYVNPEKLFSISEAKIVDEYGMLTNIRKKTPNEWYRLFNRKSKDKSSANQLPKISVKGVKKNKFKQFKVFFIRDVLSKIANKQYLMINFIEAPLLALILSFFVKYYKNESKMEYSFYENINIPQYLFISVIVALFIGLTVSVEEIFKDRKILLREKFLNLSKFSYLLSKVFILFILSAIQMFVFVVIGNYILEIEGLYFEYWFVLFSISCLANVVGLNVSSTFNSAKVIYIIVPLIIIPQLLFSGVIVRFDKLNPMFSKKNEVPWLGNIMAARWAYESLAVIQSIDNNFEKHFFKLDQQKYDASWKKDYWIPEMKNQVLKFSGSNSTKEEFEYAKMIISNELKKENSIWENFKCNGVLEEVISAGFLSDKEVVKNNIFNYLSVLDKQYSKTKNGISKEIEKIIVDMGAEKFQVLMHTFENKKMRELVTRKRELDKILILNGELIRMDNPIFYENRNVSFFDSHFYSPNKYFNGKKVSTFYSNIIILWLMSFFFFLTLYIDFFRKLLKVFSFITINRNKKRA